MPEPKAPSVEYVHNVARAEHQIGVRSGKLFIPFSVVSDARYAQLEENAQSNADLADDNGEGSES